MLNIFVLKTKLNGSSFKIHISNKNSTETGPEAVFQEDVLHVPAFICIIHILSLGFSSIVQSINSQEVLTLRKYISNLLVMD